MQTLNPYLDPILTEIDLYLNTYPQTNEHNIIKHLQSKRIAPFEHFNLSHAKDLFNAHFLCMHALYHLKNNYLQTKTFLLTIHSIRVERLSLNQQQLSNEEVSSNSFIDIPDPLATYYLDPRHYFETQEEDITEMLKSFWEKYLAQDKKQAALATLELPQEANAQMIKDQYRRLAQKHHPDKGGCADMFNQVREAKGILDRLA